jgi:hypothetical protein
LFCPINQQRRKGMMNRYLWIVCSVVFAIVVALPGQASAASITETKAEIGQDCVANGANSTAMGRNTTAGGSCSTAMGYLTTASREYSTAMGFDTTANGWGSFAMGAGTTASGSGSFAGGDSTTASGYISIAMGKFTIAGAEYSFAGGAYMQLTEAADHTFVWGHSTSPESISSADAFLIFPGGTFGNVGIGTPNPEEKVHICRKSYGLGAAILLDSTGVTSGRKFYVGSTLAGNVGGAGLFQIFDVTAGQARLNIAPSGNVGIGRVPTIYKLEVEGDALKTSGGNTWKTSSDERLKDITGEYERGLDAITSLRPVTFFYKQGNPRGLPTNEENIGFIAQEVQEVFPEAVSEGPDGYLDFNIHPVNVALVNSVRELKAENEALKRENMALRQDIAQIKTVLGL